MSNERIGRRKILKRTAVASGSLLTGIGGVTGTVVGKGGPKFDFNPYNIEEVGEFIESYIVKKREGNPGNLPEDVEFKEEVPQLRRLSEEQLEAIEDGITPSILRVESGEVGNSIQTQASDNQDNNVEIHAINENPLEKWDWETPEHLTKPLNENDAEDTNVGVLDASESFSNVQEQIAASIDFTAWRWKCEIHWKYTSSNITDSSHNDTVLYTNGYVQYHGTETEEIGVADDEYEVNFQADFTNDLGEICVPVVNYCVSLNQSFSPVQQLKGDTNGNGEVVLNQKDTLIG